MRRSGRGQLSRISLFVIVALSLAALAVVSDRAVVEWRGTAIRLAEQRAGASVDLLVTVFNRNMRAVQSSVLHAGLLTIDDTHASATELVSRALASYNYPEVFFAWSRDAAPASVAFYARAERYPPWLEASESTPDFPVVKVTDDGIGERLLQRAGLDAALGRRYSVFDIDLGPHTYQVISVLAYSGKLSDLRSVFGFMVNLGWAEKHYVTELTAQVARMGKLPDNAFNVHVTDEVKASSGLSSGGAGGRTFPLAFFDPRVVAVAWPHDLRRRTVAVTALATNDAALVDTLSAARRIRVIVWGAAIGLIVALMLTLRRYERLAKLRSDFVSSVTHELKTPVATISAISEIFAAGRAGTPEVSQRHGLLAFQEAKRLTRLIDNLLAHTRITDVTEAYQFERLSVYGLVEDALADFHTQLTVSGFTVNVEAPDDLPPLRADRVAMRLVLGNLIDNAIRYSPEARELTISARADQLGMVTIEVSDRGLGIPDNELRLITRKFFRGERADRAGTGLGLSIVARIVQDHRGTLQFRSVVGAGTTVVVQLPEAQS